MVAVTGTYLLGTVFFVPTDRNNLVASVLEAVPGETREVSASSRYRYHYASVSGAGFHLLPRKMKIFWVPHRDAPKVFSALKGELEWHEKTF